ncbi:RDD family protein [Mycobacterium sp. 155]|uniref:RDD family protein n=1 Tax=Mycobacterium sp. 155 TaxID=1157943 RepID=UPI000377B6AB|nr:RDD family protein [Mycobacterium sp. 155]
MTTVLDTASLDIVSSDTVDSPAATAAPEPALASWPVRAGAFAIDVLLGLAVIVTLGVLAAASPTHGWLWWVYVGVAVAVGGAMLLNRVVAPATTGWTLGRSVFGIRVATAGGDAGLVRLTLRELAHLLDTAALCIGWLWPLWDSRNRTFADLLARTEVRRVAVAEEHVRGVRRRAAVAMLAAALLCGSAVGLGYWSSYRQELTVQQARAQLADQGPRTVEQLLSYGIDSMDQDFARALTLTTDNYRTQLAEQQAAVRKAGPNTNEYWAVSSAVLPGSTKTEGTMLLALQGQRGIDPKNLKFLTATVRVDFRKIDGQWRVDNLTVLTKPQMNGAG